MKLFITVFIMLLATSCTTLRTFEQEKTTIRTDTVVRVDTVVNRISIPGETKTVYVARIDTVCIPDIRNGTFCLDTIWLRTQYAAAWFGIRNNEPFLGLTQQDIELLIESYERQITILKNERIESRKETIKELPFYRNNWFWGWLVFVVIVAFPLLLKTVKRILKF